MREVNLWLMGGRTQCKNADLMDFSLRSTSNVVGSPLRLPVMRKSA